MIYQLHRIVRDVKIAIDENRTGDQLLRDEDIDTLSLDEIVESKIEEAARYVVLTAPLHLLGGGRPVGDSIYWREDGSGWMLLPDDFLRMLVFKMSDWERPVFEPVMAGDTTYQLQFSRYKGLRGNPQKPVVAIVNRAEGRVLELFSCRSREATIEQGGYIALPQLDNAGGIEIPERCYAAVVYETAGLVLATIGSALASTMTELSKRLLI